MTTQRLPLSSPGPVAADMPAAPPAPARHKQAFDQRFFAPILITCILLLGQLTYGILESYPKTLLAIVASILAELILGKLFTGKIPHLASAYISGISVGILVRSPEFWPYALCAIISITSKYLIRVNGRHLWNPSNLGIVALLIFAHDSVATLSIQWGNDIWPMLVVWALGSFIVLRLKRFHICATYVVSFVVYAYLRTLFNGNAFWAEVAPITGPMYQLFIFFMITDPKTTTQTRWGQMSVAFLVATVESAIRLWAPDRLAIHAPYYALFLMGPSANLLEIALQRRHRGRSLTETADAAAVGPVASKVSTATAGR